MTPPIPRAARGLWDSAPILLVTTTLLWSSNFIIGRAAIEHLPPIALAFWRWTVALALLIGPSWKYLRADLPKLRAAWPVVLALSALGVTLFNTLVYIGLRTTTATNGALLQSTNPLIILLFSFLLFRERVTSTQLVAVLISLCGVVVIVARGSLETLLALAVAPGDLLIFLATAGYALYTVLLRRRPQVHPLSLLSATFALGTLLLLPAYAWEHFSVGPVEPTPPVIGAVLYVGIFPSIVSFLCFNRATELIGPARAGQYMHLTPAFGSLLAVIFLGERLHLFHFAGAGLIATGILLADAKRRAREAASAT
ncbi:MAG: DMT family transporter [Pseudomonadota bacterium]|jgi:Permeases of the drug/metabolite transporter (DMT) superfamily|nr:MAG: EamA family transporter [Pseudomonadota bacterium]